jgi:hypothetical protein
MGLGFEPGKRASTASEFHEVRIRPNPLSRLTLLSDSLPLSQTLMLAQSFFGGGSVFTSQ